MDKVITIYDAKANLSKLVKQAQAGKTVYIGAFGVPQAIIAPLPAKRSLKLGVWQGKHKISYSDEELMNNDPDTIRSITSSELFPKG